MKKAKIWGIALFLIVALAVVVANGTFTVDETKYAVVLRFGKVVEVVKEPGLHFKTPFVDDVVYLEKRLLMYDVKPSTIYTVDKRNIIIDTFAIWRISDPEVFLETMRSVSLAITRIDDVVYSNVRDVFARYSLDDILSEEREKILAEVTEKSRKALESFGIEIIDVRVKHTDLPSETLSAVFNRMRSERYQKAAAIRAEGEREARKIKAEADRKARVILAEAKKKAQEMMGQGEAQAMELYRRAYSVDPNFYAFWRSLMAYKETLKDSVIIIDERFPFLNLLLREATPSGQ